MSADQETRLWLTMLRDYIETRIKAALPFVRDGKLDLSSKNIVGTLPATSGGSGTNTGGEPTLGNPPGDYYVLTSTAAGVRQWMQIIGTSGITVAVDPGAGTITISNATLLDTMTFGPDDLIWGGNPLGWSTT